MEKKCFSPEGAPTAVGPYNHGVRVGDLLFSSGQIPLDPATDRLVDGDIGVQTDRVFDNIAIILDHEGLTFADIVKMSVFMIDLSHFARVNELYAARFNGNFPARSAVQVAALPKGAEIEIEFIANYSAR